MTNICIIYYYANIGKTLFLNLGLLVFVTAYLLSSHSTKWVKCCTTITTCQHKKNTVIITFADVLHCAGIVYACDGHRVIVDDCYKIKTKYRNFFCKKKMNPIRKLTTAKNCTVSGRRAMLTWRLLEIYMTGHSTDLRTSDGYYLGNLLKTTLICV